MNELSIIFNRMGSNTYEVLEAAGTKWNFLKFYPGLVGGHCIGVDPYYLTFKAKECRFHARVIDSGRLINDSMGYYVGKQTFKKLVSLGKNVLKCKVLVMGVTFKENVRDIRNSRVPDVITELKSYGVTVDITDPRASSKDFKHEYGFELTKDIAKDYDAVIVAVNHNEYSNLTEDYFKSITKNNNGLVVDVKGIYRGKIKELTYWSL
jgi:UDP-N-acetyl-D-galactosamine dehydrogenase